MHASLPPLAWLDDFCNSITAAIGEDITYAVSDTDEEMVKSVKFHFRSHISIKSLRLVNELLHSWAKSNGCGTIGNFRREGFAMLTKIAIKRQFGQMKIRHPLGDKK